MFWDVRHRLLRAADAFMAPPPPPDWPQPLDRPPPLGASAFTLPGPPFPRLNDEAKGSLQAHTLGLLDDDVRGWLIVTVRDCKCGADIDIEWRIPDGAWPAVGACLLGSAL